MNILASKSSVYASTRPVTEELVSWLPVVRGCQIDNGPWKPLDGGAHQVNHLGAPGEGGVTGNYLFVVLSIVLYVEEIWCLSFWCLISILVHEWPHLSVSQTIFPLWLYLLLVSSLCLALHLQSGSLIPPLGSTHSSFYWLFFFWADLCHLCVANEEECDAC